jgi:hypothetical protein
MSGGLMRRICSHAIPATLQNLPLFAIYHLPFTISL